MSSSVQMFINVQNAGVKCTLSEFPDDIKLEGVVSTFEGWEALQRALGRL